MSVSALFDLSSRVAVVTGASSGIGRTIALALADAGAAVVLVARREAELEQLRHEIERAGGRAASLPCDLADRRDHVLMTRNGRPAAAIVPIREALRSRYDHRGGRVLSADKPHSE